MEGHPFLDSDFPAEPEPSFEALGHAGSDHYAGLETFENPGCILVAYTSDEVVATCPITGQPDFYTCTIEVVESELLVESKSLKLWFQNLMKNSIQVKGAFCESLAVLIRNTVAETCGVDEEKVRVTLIQKSRGGISIRAVA